MENGEATAFDADARPVLAHRETVATLCGDRGTLQRAHGSLVASN